MEVLTPPANNDPAAPLIAPEDPAAAAHSPRTRHLVSHLLQRVLSLNRRTQLQDQAVAVAATATTTEITVSARKCPYSAVERNPDCPYVFQMPLHYPRYSKQEYESMPEWQLDRLLEEYGVPVSGSLEDKREYAIGAFLWRS